MNRRVVFGRSSLPAGRLLRPAGFAVGAALALTIAFPANAAAPASTSWTSSATETSAAQPSWFQDGSGQAAKAFIALLATARLDGLDPADLNVGALQRAMVRAQSTRPNSVRAADRKFNDAFVRYVKALKEGADRGWVLVDRELAPGQMTPRQILGRAAAAPSLVDYVSEMRFMHPAYGKLRRQLALASDSGDRDTEALVRVNLQRARMLPSDGRYVLVNAAAQRLQMIDDNQVVDEMKVVVGKQKYPTPVMAAYIRYAALNPYWEVPADLAAERVAPNVVNQGVGYLKKHGYVVLTDWGAKAQAVDPSTIDWQAVADGKIVVRLRQNPGPGNSMGRMKFMFPNSEGVYLHDTPEKALLKEDARLFSGGCVRLEDAARLGKWLFGHSLDPKGATPDQKVELAAPVPVYIAYLTAVPERGELARYDDIYDRDAPAPQSDAAALAGAF